jgi:hypothetical protein
MPPSKPNMNFREVNKMRNVRSGSNTTNPLALFAAGVEQTVREKIYSPTDYKDYELDAMARKEQSKVIAEPKFLTKLGFHVVDIFKMLPWIKPQVNS